MLHKLTLWYFFWNWDVIWSWASVSWQKRGNTHCPWVMLFVLNGCALLYIYMYIKYIQKYVHQETKQETQILHSYSGSVCSFALLSKHQTDSVLYVISSNRCTFWICFNSSEWKQFIKESDRVLFKFQFKKTKTKHYSHFPGTSPLCCHWHSLHHHENSSTYNPRERAGLPLASCPLLLKDTISVLH